MSIVITSEILQQSGLSEEQIRIELALIFYRFGNISLGKAAEFAQMHKIRFQHLLAEKQIPLHYDEADLAQDLDTLSKADL